MTEFPSQSHKSREPRVVEPVTTNPGRVRAAPAGRRLKETIFQGDARSVWTSMIWDTFFPNLRDNFADAVHNGIDALFGGYSTAGRSRSRYGGSYRGHNISKHNPDRALGRGSDSRQRDDALRDGDTSVVELDSRVEAQEVLNQMNLLIDQFDQCTMADFKRMVQITPTHVDFGLGWEELGEAHVVSSKGSYYLDLPDPIRLSSK